MMRHLFLAAVRFVSAVGATMVLTGCGLQLGAVAGHAIALEPGKNPTDRDTGRFMWAGNVATSTVFGKQRGVLLGGELEARTEYRLGGRWTSGMQFGYAWLPARERWAKGFEIHADLGTRIEDGILFKHGNYYAGTTAALVLWASERHDAYDADSSPWLLVRAIELVAGPRFRCNVDDDPNVSWGSRCDIGLTFALRLRVVSDLVE